MIEKIKRHKIDIIIIGILLLIVITAHGYNMFHYPYYENDEGTYMSQAWSVTETGRLAPYTYWYDHAPGGWLQIALWAKLTGGYFTFGESINSGRVFMLVIHCVTVLLLYGVLRRTIESRIYSFFGAFLFAVSPLAIEIGRRILLDPIMIMWVLASVFVLLGDHRKLRHFILSAIFFAIAVLTKEPAIFFFPALIYLVYTKAHIDHRRIAIVQWLAVFGVLISLYPMFALIKGEFFAYGSIFGGSSQHVSLIETLKFQSTRTTEGHFWDPNGGFQFYFHQWREIDPILMIIGLFMTFFALILSYWHKSLRIIVILTLCFWIFLIRGGIVIEFYIMPLLPLLAACIAGVTYQISRILGNSRVVHVTVLVLLMSVTAFIHMHYQDIYTKDQTAAQKDALTWVQKNIPSEAFILIDNYAYVDITYEYPNAHYYWKAEKDPEIRDVLLENKWHNVDYILSTGQLEYDSERENFTLVAAALENSEPLIEFNNDDYTVTIRKVIKPSIQISDSTTLQNTYSYYISNFIKDGRVIDPYEDDRTVSEGQSYMMMRSVWSDDKESFDEVWNWTKNNLQVRDDDSLFGWLWLSSDNGDGAIEDYESASDADQDIALALLFAYKKWGDDVYRDEAISIINDIWEYEVVEIQGNNILVSNTNSQREDAYLVNPSYLSPATYRIFAEADPAHDWISLVDSTYELLEEISAGKEDGLLLPPDWVLIDSNTDSVSSATEYVNSTADDYGYDAFRTMWRIALDAQWYQEIRAVEYLNKYEAFFSSQWDDDTLVSVYSTDGTPKTSLGNISTDIGPLSVFTITDQGKADKFYQDRIDSVYNEQGYWEESTNYYGQNWAWFGTALYDGFLTNIWSIQNVTVETVE